VPALRYYRQHTESPKNLEISRKIL